MRIMFTGGGTAGHIFPIIAIVRELNRMGVKAEYVYIGPKDDFGAILLSQEGINIKIISSGKIRRYLNWQGLIHNAFDIFLKIPLGLAQSFFYILFRPPNIIFSKGGNSRRGG